MYVSMIKTSMSFFAPTKHGLPRYKLSKLLPFSLSSQISPSRYFSFSFLTHAQVNICNIKK